jgi:hypothetical protein
MRKLFVIHLVLISLMSFPSWGSEINGSYICNYKLLSDGSSDTTLIKVSSSGLVSQHLDSRWKSNYQLIHKNSETGVSVFQFHVFVLILSPTDNDDRIEWNGHSFVEGEDNDRLSRGFCKRSYIN